MKKRFLTVLLVFMMTLFLSSVVSAATITESVSPGTRIPVLASGSGPGYMVPDSIITFTEAGIINSMEVYLNISHTYQGDLWIDLYNPGSTSHFDLWNGTGGSTNNIIGTFDVSSWASGMDLSGEWRLQVYDDAGADIGTLNSWSISADFAPAGGGNPVPEPGTMILFGIGLLGLAGVNRRKK